MMAEGLVLGLVHEIPFAERHGSGRLTFDPSGGAMKLKIILEPSDDGGYTASVPSLPGCLSEGDALDEAMANIQEAIDLYLEPVEDDLMTGEGIEVRELVV